MTGPARQSDDLFISQPPHSLGMKPANIRPTAIATFVCLLDINAKKVTLLRVLTGLWETSETKASGTC